MFNNSKKLSSVKLLFFLILLIIFSSATYFIKLNNYSFSNHSLDYNYTHYSEQNLINLISCAFYNFTFQNNFLFLLFCIGALNSKFRNNKNYSLLAFCILIDILLTGIV
nr:hypothetical protein ['Parthenium hysterophorus' phyllody phytoplasma]